MYNGLSCFTVRNFKYVCLVLGRCPAWYKIILLFIFLTCTTNAAIISNWFLWHEVCETDQDSRWTSVRIMGQTSDITGKDHPLDQDE